MINPDKYIRKALVDELSLAVAVPFYDTAIPIDIHPLPTRYGVIRSQSKGRFADDKSSRDWMSSVTIELFSVNELGFVSTVDVDDMETVVINTMPDLSIPNLDVKFIRFVDSVNSPINTLTQSVSRRVIVYDFWINSSEL